MHLWVSVIMQTIKSVYKIMCISCGVLVWKPDLQCMSDDSQLFFIYYFIVYVPYILWVAYYSEFIPLYLCESNSHFVLYLSSIFFLNVGRCLQQCDFEMCTWADLTCALHTTSCIATDLPYIDECVNFIRAKSGGLKTYHLSWKWEITVGSSDDDWIKPFQKRWCVACAVCIITFDWKFAFSAL